MVYVLNFALGITGEKQLAIGQISRIQRETRAFMKPDNLRCS